MIAATSSGLAKGFQSDMGAWCESSQCDRHIAAAHRIAWKIHWTLLKHYHTVIYYRRVIYGGLYAASRPVD